MHGVKILGNHANYSTHLGHLKFAVHNSVGDSSSVYHSSPLPVNVLNIDCFDIVVYSYVSMEEQLAACESHLQEKADELEALQKEVPFTVV